MKLFQFSLAKTSHRTTKWKKLSVRRKWDSLCLLYKACTDETDVKGDERSSSWRYFFLSKTVLFHRIKQRKQRLDDVKYLFVIRSIREIYYHNVSYRFSNFPNKGLQGNILESIPPKRKVFYENSRKLISTVLGRYLLKIM